MVAASSLVGLAFFAASSVVAVRDNAMLQMKKSQSLASEVSQVDEDFAVPENVSDASASSMTEIKTFFWNVHWQCSTASRGASHNCKHSATAKFAQLAQQHGANIVASIELSNGMSDPVHLPLSGWTQVSGPCKRGSRGDSSALAFAPGWHVLGSGGGCLRHDSDTRAFSVARVQPPSPVKGCSSLCVVAVHAPHRSITNGHGEVSRVCGEAKNGCALAMGDWNVPANQVGRLWGAFIGGSGPNMAVPNQRTCCYPESDHYGVYDHLASNIPGAVSAGYHVLPYQVLSENPVEEHRPVVARINVPGR